MPTTDATVHLDPAALAEQMATDVRAGLTRTPKVLPPKYFYDARGSDLVEPDGVVVASEPWDDDPRWVDVPDRHLIEVTPAGVTVTALES